MDPFSLGLGVLSVIQASASAAKGLYEFVDTVVHAKGEVADLGREVDAFHRTVRRLEVVLKEQAVVQYIKRHTEVDEDLATLKRPIKLCNEQMDTLIKELRDNTNLYTDGTREVKSFRWYFVKDGVLKTREDLVHARGILSNALQTLDYIQNLRDRAEKDRSPKPPPSPQPSITGQLEETQRQARALRKAACDNDEKTADLLLNAGIAPDTRNREGRTALSLAAQHGSVQVARLLLKHSRNSEVSANTVMDVVEGNYRKKSESKRSPLHWAAASGHNEMVGLLLDAGAKIETPNASQRTPMLEAAISGHLSTIEYMLSRGASVSARTYYGWTMLHSAASHGKMDLAQLLLDNGADPEAVYTGGWHGESKNGKGRGLQQRPLHYAAWPSLKPIGDETAMLRLLVQKGQAYVKATDSQGATPLHYAIRSDWYAGTEELLKLNASPVTKDTVGDTPLHEAVKRSDIKTVKLLLEYYPPKSYHSKNQQGQTALTIARMENNPGIVKILQGFMTQSDG